MDASVFMPPEVWCAATADDVKSFPVDTQSLSHEVFSATSGPGNGVEYVHSLATQTGVNNNESDEAKPVTKSLHWGHRSRKACGMSLSLYDRNPVTGKVSGDPIADCFAQVARKNSTLMVIADGVNWGEKSRRAARCAVSAVVDYLQEVLFGANSVSNTKEAFKHMRKAFDVAHESILKHKGGLTTLNVTLVLPIEGSIRYAVCSVNVGDSLTYVFSKRYGMNELSVGSHDINEERNMKDAGGAIGPVNGDQPYLTNLTFSCTTCEPGDIIFLTTDGVSDNFDPVVTKIAVAGRKDSLLQSVDHKPEMLPEERHLFATKGMERVIHEYELETELDISAQELCTALTQHVQNLTAAKRRVIENPIYYNRKYKAKECRKIEDSIKEEIRLLPGKLDHATVVAYEAGFYRDEMTANVSDDTNYSKSIKSLCSTPSSLSSNCSTAELPETDSSL